MRDYVSLSACFNNGACHIEQNLRTEHHSLAIRPRVSNDNPYPESLFRTLKFCPQWLLDGFCEIALHLTA